MPEISGDCTQMFVEGEWVNKTQAELIRYKVTPSIETGLASIAQSFIVISQRLAL